MSRSSKNTTKRVRSISEQLYKNIPNEFFRGCWYNLPDEIEQMDVFVDSSMIDDLLYMICEDIKFGCCYAWAKVVNKMKEINAPKV